MTRAAVVDAAAGRCAPAAGAGVLRIVRTRRGSVVSRALAASPLRLLTPRNHGAAAWIYTSTYGGGLVDGDALHLTVEVGPQATAFLSTQASTKVYRAPVAVSSSELHATLLEGSILVVAPDPVVCFAAARYRQRQSFALDRADGLVLVDWYTSGRHAMGERWSFEEYVSRTDVRRGGRLIWYDALRLTASDDSIAERTGRFDVMASIAIFGPAFREHAAGMVALVSGMPVERRARAIVSASAVDDGCVVRLAGVSVEEIGRTIRRFLEFVPRVLGDDPWARRW